MAEITRRTLSRETARVFDEITESQSAVMITRWAARLGAAYGLRTLGAIHVATALALKPGLVEVVTYDRRMMVVCTHLGMSSVAPGAIEG